VSLAEWSSVYENYYASAMRACEGVRRCPSLFRPCGRSVRRRLLGRGQLGRDAACIFSGEGGRLGDANRSVLGARSATG